jgi:hypothetical protein
MVSYNDDGGFGESPSREYVAEIRLEAVEDLKIIDQDQ